MVGIFELAFAVFALAWTVICWWPGGRGLMWLRGSFKYHLNRKAILDRIAELEKNLKVANTRRVELRAMVRALLEVIQGDRQKYRSQAAQHIRVFLEEVEAQATMMNEPNPSIDQIEFWKKVAIINT